MTSKQRRIDVYMTLFSGYVPAGPDTIPKNTSIHKGLHCTEVCLNLEIRTYDPFICTMNHIMRILSNQMDKFISKQELVDNLCEMAPIYSGQGSAL